MGLLNVLRKDDVAAVDPMPEVLRKSPDKTHKLITTRRYPIYYLGITKCGSTFLKNLFYALDHDAPHPDGETIHDYPLDLIRAVDTPLWMIRRSPYAFTVLREPVDRFLSFYFDKIYGTGAQNFAELRLKLVEDIGLDLTPRLSAEGHIANCMALLDWLERNLAQDTDEPINPHWRPQMTRIDTVERMKIGIFTLDGLDWQMPLHFAKIIPNLSQTMDMVKSRNPAQYPVDKALMKTDDLVARVRSIYPRDAEKYALTTAHWAKRAKRIEAPFARKDDASLHVLSTYRFNLNAIVIPKAGCSYVRNLFYALDHGRLHDTPNEIDNDGSLRTCLKGRSEIAQGTSIIVLRDPVARFFSLYFDKAWGQDGGDFHWIAKALKRNRRFKTSRVLSVDEHHDNCCRLLGFLEKRMEQQSPDEQNAHWRAQYLRAEAAQEFDLKPVLLEDFEAQIKIVADGKIRGLEDQLAAVSFRNESAKPVDVEALKSAWLIDRIHTLYAEDMALYERVRAGWAQTGEPPAL